MAEDAGRHLRTLGLKPGATTADIKQAYRELAQVWHPDHFANAPQLRETAQVKMAEINAAYQYLKTHASGSNGASPGSAAGSSPASHTPAEPSTQNKWRTDYRAPSSQTPPGSSASNGSTSQASTTNSNTPPDVTLLPIAHVLHDVFAPVTGVDVSPDSRWIVAASGPCVVWWRAETGEKLREIQMERGECNGLQIDAKGRQVAVAINLSGWLGRRKSEVRMCDLETGSELRRYKLDGHILSLDISQDGKQLAVGSTTGEAQIRDLDTGHEIQRLGEDAEEGEMRRVAYVASHYATKQVVTLRTSPTLSEIGLWEVRRARLLKAYSLHVRECLRYGQVNDVLPSPDGNLLLVANNDPGNRNYSLHLWDVKTGAEVGAMRGHAADITAITWSGDGKWIASGSEDKTVRVWNVQSGKEQARGMGHARKVRSIAFAPDGSWLVSGGEDKAVCVWRFTARY